MVETLTAASAAPQARDPGPVRGQHGRLAIDAERIGDRTRLARVDQQPPLQVLRATYPDAGLPDLASITIASPAGGVLQGDRLETSIVVRRGARLHVGTQSATRIYRAPDLPAVLTVSLDVDDGGYLEYLPDPVIPYDGSRLDASMACRVARDGTLIVADAIVGGRLARGERFGLQHYRSVIEIQRPDGELLLTDAILLGDEPVDRIGRIGQHLALGTLYVVHAGFDPGILRSGVGGGLAGDLAGAAMVGASELPNGAGAWLRVLADDARSVTAVLRGAWTAARMQLLGTAPPIDRRP